MIDAMAERADELGLAPRDDGDGCVSRGLKILIGLLSRWRRCCA